jgi:drug/metabolite transporter (DMT)-like permease
LELTGLKLVVGAGLAFALTFTIDGTPEYGSLSAEAALALVALGVLSTGVAFTIFIWFVQSAGSVNASLVTYIVPVSGLLLGWLVLGEDVGINTALGAALIAGGVYGVMYHPKASVQRPARQSKVLVPKEDYA